MRRACSSDVSRSPSRDAAQCSRAVQARARRSRPRRPAGRGRRSAPRGRPARGSRATTRAPARSRRRARAPLEPASVVERHVGARARRDAEARQREHALRLLPGREVGELVGADEEDRVAQAARRAACPTVRGVPVEHDLAARERRARARAASRPGSATSLCPGSATTKTTSRSRPNCSLGGAASATWPMCGGSNAPPSRPITRSPSVSSPTTTSSPSARRRRGARLELLVAAGGRRRGSRGRCAGSGSRRRAAGAGRRGSRRAPRVGLDRSPAGRARTARAGTPRCRRRSRTETRKTATIRSSSTPNAGGSGSRSILFSTTTCGRSSRPAPYSASSRSIWRELLVGVARGRVDHVDEQPGPLEVREELVAEPDALARALDQTGDVRDHQLAAVRRVDRAEHRLERRERVVRDLRPGVRDPREQRRLARVRQPDERRVGEQLQPQLELGAPRRAAPSRRSAASGASASRNARLPRPPRAAARDDDPRARAREVGDEPAVLADLGADRQPELDVRAVGAVLARPAPVLAVACPGSRLRAKRERSRRSGSATSTTSPPRPPSPPSGPPFGTYFSRRKLEPAVAAPARLTWMRARSWNIGCRDARPGDRPALFDRIAERSGAGDRLATTRDGAALAARPELDVPSCVAKIVSSRPMPVPGRGGSGSRAGGR